MSACVSHDGPVWWVLASHVVTAEILVSLISAALRKVDAWKEEALGENVSVPEEMTSQA